MYFQCNQNLGCADELKHGVPFCCLDLHQLNVTTLILLLTRWFDWWDQGYIKWQKQLLSLTKTIFLEQNVSKHHICEEGRKSIIKRFKTIFKGVSNLLFCVLTMPSSAQLQHKVN